MLMTCSTMKIFGANWPFIFQKGEHFVNETIGRIKTSTDAVKSVAETDLVIEAIVENLDVKKKLFSSLDGAAPQYVFMYDLGWCRHTKCWLICILHWSALTSNQTALAVSCAK